MVSKDKQKGKVKQIMKEYVVNIYLELNILVAKASSRPLDLFPNISGDHDFSGAMMSNVWDAGKF